MKFTPVTQLQVGLALGGTERSVGQLLWADRRIFFEFDASFLAAPLPISPQHLPVKPGLLEERKRTFDGLFGVFDDSLPDGWGRLLLDRAMAWQGLERHRLTSLDRLAAVGTDGPGAHAQRYCWAGRQRQGPWWLVARHYQMGFCRFW
jgi:serine/threonine-protein kinase HipA